MKKLLLFAVAVVLSTVAFLANGCAKKQTLHLFCWANYIAPELIQEFEKVNNCRVVYDTFDSNEALLAKLQAGATGYDIIFPSHYVVGILAKSGKLAQIDHNRLTIMQHLDDQVLSSLPDKDCKYSIPYMMSYTGIGYNNQTVKNFEPTWHMFERTDLQKRATLLDDKREVIGAALLTLGFDPNSTKADELDRAKALIFKWIPNISKFENEQYKNGVASKEFNLVMGYSGDIGQVVEEHEHVSFVIPREGCLMSCDMLCIPTTAPNADLAYKFINFIHEPKNAALNVEYTAYLCPNKDCYEFLPEQVRNNPSIFIEKEVFKKSRFAADQGENEAVLNQLWQEIKTGH